MVFCFFRLVLVNATESVMDLSYLYCIIVEKNLKKKSLSECGGEAGVNHFRLEMP